MINFPQIEEEILKYWQDKDIFKKSLEKESKKGPFTFYEGPPTANGMPGIHHVLARAFKDLIPRFKTMQGYFVERKAGWDTHGLPVELQVEKKLEISGKGDIEKFGIGKFNEECKKSVWQYQKDWEKLTERIAFWVDMEKPYVTYHKDYVESLWWIFKEVYKQDLLYQGHKVVPHCPRCGTALSSHEVAQGYKEVTEPSVYIKFKVLKGNNKVKENDYILSWTTTPWTLPGNVALAISEKYDYVRIELNNEYYVLAKDRLEVIGEDYKVIDEFKGKDLIGLEYEPLFKGAIPEDTENYDKAFHIYPASFVTVEDGTGVVHTPVMYGEDDYELGKQVNLPMVHTVDEEGKFVDTVKEWAGKFVKSNKVQEGITNDLDKRGLLLKAEDYTHDYPFCWRCSTPLLYYAKDSWFFKMSSLQKELIKENEKINWVPEHIKEGRFGEWLSKVKDWAISRERYWGTPLPIWKCEACSEIKVIGSYEELSELTGDKNVLKDDFDPHRPYIDEYKFECKCGSSMQRVKEVADCWFDSGAMPFAQHHYPFENKEKIESKDYYPADFISEAIDQTRGWFYTLLAVGVLAKRGTSYKNVICLGHINDSKGKKMSKSIGNIVEPWEVIDKWGSDALRFHLYTINQPGESKNFDIKDVETVVKKNFNILFNVLRFYHTYESGKIEDKEPKSKNILDEWILSKLNVLIENITNNLEEYNIFSAGRSITEFIDDLSTWYLRRSRDRFKNDDLDDKEKAVATLGYTLFTLSKLMAPFTPFIADKLYQDLKGDLESVHLEAWPKAGKVDEKNIKEMEKTRKIVELALAKRDEAKIKVRQPLLSTQVFGAEVSGSYIDILKEEVNVKEVVFTKGKELKVELDTKLTDELKEEGMVRELIRTINQLRKEAKLTIHDSITLDYESKSDMVKKVIDKYNNELLKGTLSTKIQDKKEEDYLIDKEKEVNGDKVWFGLIK
ncbi:isoleucine--tRNA ligase [bacterium]|nr:isoleucine--tRNA ligase [bacterium]